MFDDGLVMNLVDVQLVCTLAISVTFIVLYSTRVRFERSVLGRLILANGVAWVIAITGGILYRLNAPELAQWLFLPLGIAIPAVLLWWIKTLTRARGEKGRLEQIVAELRSDAWKFSAHGRTGEAQLAYKYATMLRQALDLSGGTHPRSKGTVRDTMKIVKLGRRTVLASVLTVGVLGSGAAAWSVTVPKPDPCDAQYTPGGTDVQMTNRLRNYLDCRLDRVEKAIPTTPPTVTVPGPTTTVTGPTTTVTGPTTTETKTVTVTPTISTTTIAKIVSVGSDGTANNGHAYIDYDMGTETGNYITASSVNGGRVTPSFIEPSEKDWQIHRERYRYYRQG